MESYLKDLKGALPLIGEPRTPSLSAEAWMTERDFEIVSSVTEEALRQSNEVFVVVEWGSGKSTIAITQQLQATHKDFVYLSLENDRDFLIRNVLPHLEQSSVHIEYEGETNAEFVRHQVAEQSKRIIIVSWAYGPLFPAQKGRFSPDASADLDDYVSLPGKTFEAIDLAIVDGRKRRRCLVEASKLLKNSGVVFLHDAYRPYYSCAFDAFRLGERIGDELWIGSHRGDFKAHEVLSPTAYQSISSMPLAEVLSEWSPPQ
jgi:hypothetical protein